uniref:Uncharacterized protein n=1 Tax=Arundo donax TaxID=35708 RepID=A0A0A9E2D4_ARUDO
MYLWHSSNSSAVPWMPLHVSHMLWRRSRLAPSSAAAAAAAALSGDMNSMPTQSAVIGYSIPKGPSSVDGGSARYLRLFRLEALSCDDDPDGSGESTAVDIRKLLLFSGTGSRKNPYWIGGDRSGGGR